MIIKVNVKPDVFARLTSEVLPKLVLPRAEADKIYRDWLENRTKNFGKTDPFEGEMIEVVKILRAPYDSRTGVLNVTLEIDEQFTPPSEHTQANYSVPVRIVYALIEALGSFPKEGGRIF